MEFPYSLIASDRFVCLLSALLPNESLAPRIVSPQKLLVEKINVMAFRENQNDELDLLNSFA